MDQRPAAVALPESPEDIVTIVNFARAHGLRVAPQGTGHNAHPLEDALTESILVTFATIPAPALTHLHMDPEHPVAAKGDGMLLSALPSEAVDALVDAGTGECGSALLSVEVRQLGGAIARSAHDHGALEAVEAPYAMYAVGGTPTAELASIVVDQVSSLKHALSAWSAPYGHLNFSERRLDSRKFYASEYTYRRLQSIKARYDPSDVIQSNHPIRPAS